MTSGFGERWAEAGEEFEPSNGSYEVQIVEASAFMAKNDDREFCKLGLKILEGPDKGKEFEDFRGFGSKIQMRITRDALLLYGLDPAALGAEADIYTLDDALQKLIGNTASVTVKHKDGFMNVNVQGSRTGQSDIPNDPAPAKTPVPDDDSIPWE